MENARLEYSILFHGILWYEIIQNQTPAWRSHPTSFPELYFSKISCALSSPPSVNSMMILLQLARVTLDWDRQKHIKYIKSAQIISHRYLQILCHAWSNAHDEMFKCLPSVLLLSTIQSLGGNYHSIWKQVKQKSVRYSSQPADGNISQDCNTSIGVASGIK